MNKCCYYCRQFRRLEVKGQKLDKKIAGGCRLRGILIGWGPRKRAELSPLSFGCNYWRPNDGR